MAGASGGLRETLFALSCWREGVSASGCSVGLGGPFCEAAWCSAEIIGMLAAAGSTCKAKSTASPWDIKGTRCFCA